MSKTRLYIESPIASERQLIVSGERARYISRVLRLKINDKLTLFDGSGAEFSAEIAAIRKRDISLIVTGRTKRSVESPLTIHLLQGISRGDRMDLVIRKATELGVKRITPICADYSVVKFELERAKKRLKHWHSIAFSACEQCGRNIVPEITLPISLQEWIANNKNEQNIRLILKPNASVSINSIAVAENSVTVLVGPEGGFSDSEYALARSNNFKSIRFGPRILRTETAAIAIISTLQAIYGDLN